MSKPRFIACERKWFRKGPGYTITSVRVFDTASGAKWVGHFQFADVAQAVSELVGRKVDYMEIVTDSVWVGRRSDLHWVGDQ